MQSKNWSRRHLTSALSLVLSQMYENVLKVCLPWLWDLDESVWVLLPQTSNDGAAAATACRQVARGKGRGGGYSLKYDKMLFETFSVIDTPVSRRQREMNALAG